MRLGLVSHKGVLFTVTKLDATRSYLVFRTTDRSRADVELTLTLVEPTQALRAYRRSGRRMDCHDTKLTGVSEWSLAHPRKTIRRVSIETEAHLTGSVAPYLSCKVGRHVRYSSIIYTGD